MEELSTNEYLRGIVLNLPSSPGIYQYLNKEGVIIYVGKAKNLKRRVYSYFSKEHQSAENIRCLRRWKGNSCRLSAIHYSEACTS